MRILLGFWIANSKHAMLKSVGSCVLSTDLGAFGKLEMALSLMVSLGLMLSRF
jgi:hypothetical protein